MSGANENVDIRLRAVVESAPVGLLVVDTDGRMVLVNRQVEQMFGYSREDLLGKPVEKLIPARFAESHPSFRSDYLSRPRVREMGAGRELFGVRKDGSELPVEIGLTPVASAEGLFVIGSIVDITERRNAEVDRLRLEEALRAAQKVETVSTMARSVAHEFNNILAAIIGCAELLQSSTTEPQAQQDLDTLLQAAQRGAEIVQHVRSASQRHGRSLQPIRLVDIVEEAARLLRVTLPEHVDLILDASDDGVRVLAESTSIQQVIMNLVNNAVDAMSQGGEIHIEYGYSSPPDESRNRRGQSQEGREVVLRVSDSGHGIEDDLLDQVFEPFFTSRSTEGGTGLGLAIVHDIMSAHKGRVQLESRVGHGTTVSCWFPIDDEISIEAHESVRPDLQGGSGQRLLLVDDEPAVRTTCRRILESLGYRVEVVASGEEGLQLLDSDTEGFELVLTDISMSGMTGIDFVREMRSAGFDTPVVIVSGHVPDIPTPVLNDLGICDVAVKPVRRAGFAQLISSAFSAAGLRG